MSRIGNPLEAGILVLPLGVILQVQEIAGIQVQISRVNLQEVLHQVQIQEEVPDQVQDLPKVQVVQGLLAVQDNI